MGSQGRRLFRFRDINQTSQAAITASDLASAADPATLGMVTGGYGVPRPFGNNPYGAFYIMQQETTALDGQKLDARGPDPILPGAPARATLTMS